MSQQQKHEELDRMRMPYKSNQTPNDSKRWKKRASAYKPTTNKFWSSIVQTPKNATTSAFQAPHHQQDSMVDLTDDTSPNIPMGEGQTSNNSGIPQTHFRQENPLKTPIVLGLNSSTQHKADEKQQQTAYNRIKSGAKNSQKSVPESHGSNIRPFDSDNPASPNTNVATTSTTADVNTDNGNNTVDKTDSVHVEQLEKPLIYLSGKTINTRISTGQAPTKAKPQQYRLPTTQEVFKPPAKPQVTPQRVAAADLFNYTYPKGIPKSFLLQPSPSPLPQPLVNPYSGMQLPAPGLHSWPLQLSTPAPHISPQLAPQITPQMPPQLPPQIPSQLAPPTQAFGFAYNAGQDSQPTYGDQDSVVQQQAYSPSDVYGENADNGGRVNEREDSGSPDPLEPGQKRLSAFRRLGPLTQPKKPKMTINLLCNKDVREVVDETEQKYVPVHLREDIINSTDETVVKYLKFWPWEKGVTVRKTVMARSSKSVMILEHEQMEEVYEKGNIFIQISVYGYPRDWTKEMLLDTLLDVVNGKPFIPLFIEFAPQECKFLVIRSRAALNTLHKTGFVIRANDAVLNLAISQTEVTVNTLDFSPKFVLRKRLAMHYDGEASLDLSAFTAKQDISHFIYYPLNRANNQADIIQLSSCIEWSYLTKLNLSHNRLTSIDAFNLSLTTPRLRHLDLSYNCLSQATALLRCRELALRSLNLEGNPLCRDHTDPARYRELLRLMFPPLQEIDGVTITRCGELPKVVRNYCPEDAKPIIDKFLEVYFPLLDAQDKDRMAIEEMYHEKASLTVTYRYKLRLNPIYRQFRSLFLRSRAAEGGADASGAPEIARLLAKGPALEHDPLTFTVDAMHHDEDMTVFKVSGILKLTSESLADDEHLLAFSRTFVLQSTDGAEYKITNEMVYWDLPSNEYANTAFQITKVRQKRLSLKLESPPNEDLKEKLLDIFMQLTDLNKDASTRCLEHRDWNLKLALEYFVKLLKLDEIEILSKAI